MAIQIRIERERGKRAKYQYALVSAQAINYEMRELGISPLPTPDTIHLWLQQAGRIRKRKSRKPPNPTYPVLRLETTINPRHRLPALEGKTPQEFAATASLRYPPAHYEWRTRDLQLLKGKVTFIRFVRKSGRITLTAKDKFLIGKKYKWQYVLADVEVAKKKLNILWQGKHIRSFDYN